MDSDSIEKLKSLPDSEKAKYFEVFLESIELASDDSGDSEKSTNKTLNFSTILNNITSTHAIISEGNSRKKQKTLDSWLIKPKNVSPHKSKPGESSSMPKESTDLLSSSDVNNVSECLDSMQPELSSLNDVNFSCSSKTIENSLESSPSKFDKVHGSPEKNVEISVPEINETPSVITEKNRRSKRRCIDPSQLSKPKSPTKSSIFTGNSNLNRSKKTLTQTNLISNCDIDLDASSENINSDHNSNITNTDDCEEVDCVNPPFIKSTRNLRSRKIGLNLPNITRSNSKLRNTVTKSSDSRVSEKTVSPEKNNATDSSSLSNCEAFYILEKECTRINLNILDILQDETIQNVLNSPNRLDNEAIILINSFKSSPAKMLPVVHLVESRKRLGDILKKLQKPY